MNFLRHFLLAGCLMFGATSLAIMWVAMVSFSALFEVLDAADPAMLVLFILLPAATYATTRTTAEAWARKKKL